jgi:hypothetical protein
VEDPQPAAQQRVQNGLPRARLDGDAERQLLPAASLRHHRQEELDDLALVIEHTLGERVLGPADWLVIGIELVGAVHAEGLIAIAERIEEVDRRAAGDAVAAGSVIDIVLFMARLSQARNTCSGVSTAKAQ